MRQKKWAVRYRCFSGDGDWGKTGAENTIIFNTYSPSEFQSYAPGGWEIIAIERRTYAEDGWHYIVGHEHIECLDGEKS